jgi:hypothetical protein
MSEPLPVIAYADDVTVFVTAPEESHTIHHADRRYELATGSDLNPLKSKDLSIGKWKTPPSLLGIHLHDVVDILGTSFLRTIALTTWDSWARIIRAVRAQSRKSYARKFSLPHGIKFVQVYFFAKLWFVAQLILTARALAQQLTIVGTWLI